MSRLLLVLGVAIVPSIAASQQPATAISDTVIQFNVAAGTWTWPYLLAHVGLSCQGGRVTVGTNTAPDTAAKDRERYCVGAVVEMRNSTLTLRGARGAVRVRLNRTVLDSTGLQRR